MVASSSVLKRYALAYIKKSDNSSDVKEFLQFCNKRNAINWSEEDFDKVYEVYKEFVRSNLSNRQKGNQYSNGQPTSPQVVINVQHTDKSAWDFFWDLLLLQCCINSLFGGRGHTTVINNYTTQSTRDKSEDRKLLALGIAVAVVCVAFHGLMCYFYHSSKKEARKSDTMDYLDNKLKTFRNIEFAVSAISLAALIACAFYPVLPVWGLVVLGVNSLACFAGGLAFHMKHEKESDNIEKAKTAVEGCVSTPCGGAKQPEYFVI